MKLDMFAVVRGPDEVYKGWLDNTLCNQQFSELCKPCFLKPIDDLSCILSCDGSHIMSALWVQVFVCFSGLITQSKEHYLLTPTCSRGLKRAPCWICHLHFGLLPLLCADMLKRTIQSYWSLVSSELMQHAWSVQHDAKMKSFPYREPLDPPTITRAFYWRWDTFPLELFGRWQFCKTHLSLSLA